MSQSGLAVSRVSSTLRQYSCKSKRRRRGHYGTSPKILAVGGEHIICEVSDHPRVVVKLAISATCRLREVLQKDGGFKGEMTPKIAARARAHIAKEAIRMLELRRHFGAEHVLNQRQVVARVRLTDAIRSAFGACLSSDDDVIWALLVIQRRLMSISGCSMCLGAGATWLDFDMEVRFACRRILSGAEVRAAIEYDEVLLQCTGLDTVVRMARRDEELLRVVERFVASAVTYTRATDQILDLSGLNNVVLYREQGQWTYTLLDALYPGSGETLSTLTPQLKTLLSGGSIENKKRTYIQNAINYARVLNAICTGLQLRHY